MKQIEVALGERSYSVIIGDGLLARSGELLAPFARGRTLAVVSDETVWGIYGAAIGASLAAAGVEVTAITVAAGEENKSWEALTRLVDRLLSFGLERGDYVVALGGGVVGDLAGFAAAILKRGCGYVLVPTTLLAQVDSSVGGKTAINVAAGKNLVGAFHQPAAVLVDPQLLTTLPEREIRAGYAEVVKYGLIGDSSFFDWCEANGAAVIAGDSQARLSAIEASIRAKSAIVSDDERETSGRRALLNFGHTFGHALEAVTGFSERLLHGEAVALGMALAFRFSATRGLCPPEDAARVAAHLRVVGLPSDFREAGISTEPRALLAAMAHDKKKADGRLAFILARSIGDAFVDQSVEPEEVEAFLERELG